MHQALVMRDSESTTRLKTRARTGAWKLVWRQYQVGTGGGYCCVAVELTYRPALHVSYLEHGRGRQ